MLKHTSRQFKPHPTNQLRDNLPISYTLTLQPLDANPVFKKLPRTVMSLQLATYYYALQIGSRLVPEAERHQGALYTHDPSQLITAMLAATEDGPKELQKICKDLPKDTVGLIEKLHHYHELMTDFTQAQVLENLSKGEWSLIQECITNLLLVFLFKHIFFFGPDTYKQYLSSSSPISAKQEMAKQMPADTDSNKLTSTTTGHVQIKSSHGLLL